MTNEELLRERQCKLYLFCRSFNVATVCPRDQERGDLLPVFLAAMV